MKRISRIACNLIVVASVLGLAILLALKILSTPTSASAHTANKPPNRQRAMKGDAAIQEFKQRGLYDSLREAVDTARYEARWEEAPANSSQPSAYHAANPAQRLDAYFTPNGVSLAAAGVRDDVVSGAVRDDADQLPSSPEWRLTMSLVGYGSVDH